MSTSLALYVGVALPAMALGYAAAIVWRDRTAAARVAAAERRLSEQQAALERATAAQAAAEARARDAEQRCELALRSSLDGGWEWQLLSGRVQFSARWKGMLGLAPAELGGHWGCTREAWLEQVHPQDRPRFAAALDRLRAGSDARLEETLRLMHRDGSVRHVLTRALQMRGEDGRPERVIGLDTDVTRIQRVQAILDAIAEGTAGAGGTRFFAAMAEHFARALDVDCAFITECADQPPSRLRTLAWWSAQDGLRENFEYALAGTPCEEVVLGARTCFHPEHLADKFDHEEDWQAYVGLPIIASDGRVLGHLALLSRRRLGDDVLVERVYRIFLARAAAEIERLQALARLAGIGSGGSALAPTPA
jgi:PAS domain S-box-containing protein